MLAAFNLRPGQPPRPAGLTAPDLGRLLLLIGGIWAGIAGGLVMVLAPF